MTITPEELAVICAANDYLEAQVKGEAGIVVIHRFLFTWAILSGVNYYGYEDRWCYSSYEKCKAAFDAWDGTKEPENWHRHPATGRRVDENGVAYVMR